MYLITYLSADYFKTSIYTIRIVLLEFIEEEKSDHDNCRFSGGSDKCSSVTNVFSTYKLLFQYNNEIMLTSIDLLVFVVSSFEEVMPQFIKLCEHFNDYYSVLAEF